MDYLSSIDMLSNSTSKNNNNINVNTEYKNNIGLSRTSSIDSFSSVTKPKKAVTIDRAPPTYQLNKVDTNHDSNNIVQLLNASSFQNITDQYSPNNAKIIESVASSSNYMASSSSSSSNESLSSSSSDSDDSKSYNRHNSKRNGVHQQFTRSASDISTLSPYQLEAKKRELLYQIDRLEKKGISLPRRYTMADSIDDLQSEYNRLKLTREMDASVRFQRRMLMACITGIEFLNNKFDPFDVKLNGWSDSINENVEDYDDIFEELFIKYRGKAKMAPELRLLFMIGGSGVMFHLTNSMFKSSNLPDLADVMKRNPDLMQQFTQATFNTMNEQRQHPSTRGGKRDGGGGGIMNVIGSLFGGGKKATQDYYVPQKQQHTQVASQSQHFQHPQPQPSQQTVMRGPKNVDLILQEIQRDAFKTQAEDIVIGATIAPNSNSNATDMIDILSRANSSESSSIDVFINNVVTSAPKQGNVVKKSRATKKMTTENIIGSENIKHTRRGKKAIEL